jgi:hypothetical protein
MTPEHEYKKYDLNDMTRFTRDASVWGDDDLALPIEGTWSLELELNGPKGKGVGRIDRLEVGPRPAGPSASLIYVFAIIPLLSVFVLAARSWWHVRPALKSEVHGWE